jgi:hypothetical protein
VLTLSADIKTLNPWLSSKFLVSIEKITHILRVIFAMKGMGSVLNASFVSIMDTLCACGSMGFCLSKRRMRRT